MAKLGGKKIIVYRCKKAIQKDTIYNYAATLREIDVERAVILALNEMKAKDGFEDDPEVDVKIAEQVHLLRQLQETKKKINEETEHKHLNNIQTYIENSNMNIKEFDNAYMRKMIERINVYDDASIEIHFKFGGIVRKQLERKSARR